jgi:hypothetical protein
VRSWVEEIEARDVSGPFLDRPTKQVGGTVVEVARQGVERF